MFDRHLLRPVALAELELVGAGEEVVVWAVPGGRHAGPTLLAHRPSMVRALDGLARAVTTVVFIDEESDRSLGTLIGKMHASFTTGDALVRCQPVTEALKEVAEGLVVRGVDRARLVAVTTPELIRRAALEAALAKSPGTTWTNPTELVASAGGDVRLFPVTTPEPGSEPSEPKPSERRPLRSPPPPPI